MTRTSIWKAWTWLVVCITVFSISCSREQDEDNADARSDDSTIRFSYQNRIGSAIPIIAVETGLFARHGLNVAPSRFNSGPACAEALFTGAADIGAMGDTTAILALARNAPLRIVASHASGEHRHRLIVNGDSPFHTIKDLIGKRVAIKKGTSTYGGFLKLLESSDLDPDQFMVINLKPDSMPDALAAGSIDAFAASEPTPSLGEMRGGREIATLGGLGNSYPIMMLASESFLADRPDDLERFLAALEEAERFLQTRPEEALTVISRSIGLPKDVTERALARHSVRLNLDAETMDSLRESAEFLLREGLIDSTPELKAGGPLNDKSDR